MAAVKEKKQTIKDYKLLPEGSQYQLITGELVMTPAPSPRHQIISGNLFRKISHFVDEKRAGRILYSPVDVYLGDENAYQPDIVFISKDRQETIRDDGVHGAPDLVIEILSPSTAYYDIRQKFKIYEKYGVAEYWIVDPGTNSIEIYSNEEGRFLATSKAEGQGAVESPLLKGLKLTIEDVFA